MLLIILLIINISLLYFIKKQIVLGECFFMPIYYGLRADSLTHISQVESGLSCNCTCPSCRDPLIARKGNIKEHHFAHTSIECDYATETILHLQAKQILEKNNSIIIPPVLVPFLNRNLVLFDTMSIKYDRVEIEKRTGHIIPDVILYSQGRPLIVEIYVSHKVNMEKKKRIEELGISAIEINLDDFDYSNFNLQKLEKSIISNIYEKKWIYNVHIGKAWEMINKIAKIENDKYMFRCPYHPSYMEYGRIVPMKARYECRNCNRAIKPSGKSHYLCTAEHDIYTYNNLKTLANKTIKNP